MRHIPEDELHAYLDQGLSRSQCVEIESHLAGCPACQGARDGIAALRDRTTALLSRLAPTRGVPPGFDTLRRRAAEVAFQRRRRLQSVAWAASLVAAVALGWTGSSLTGDRAPVQAAQRQELPAPVPIAEPAFRQAVAAAPPASASRAAMPAARQAPARRAPRHSPDSSATAADRAAVLAVLDPVPALELSPIDKPRADDSPELEGMWRTMSWDGAQAEAGTSVPHIGGLPIVRVQVQVSENVGQRPLMVVAQQLSSGQVIRTIEGPAPDVSQLLARRAMSDPDSAGSTADSTGPRGDGGAHSMAMQMGDRMLAITGALPTDSLLAMIRRMNAEMRSRR